MANIVVLGTGGTIAGTAASAADGVGYRAAELGVQTLLQDVPGLTQLLAGDALVSEQVAQIDSKDMGFAVWQTLAQRCAHWLAQPDVRGIVITHGTDTLEETAFFLDQTLPASPAAAQLAAKPVVLTCAMRPATARLADGPQNLADAVALVRDAGAHGVLAVCAGRIHAARDVQKIHPYRLDAFSSGDAGPMGYVEEGRVRWVRTPHHQQTPCANQPASALWRAMTHTPPEQWPWVEVLHSHAEAQPRALQALADAGVQGVVLVGTGNASLHQRLADAAQPLMARGVPVVLSTRCLASQVVRGNTEEEGPIALARCNGVVLPPAKARVWLLLQRLPGTL